MRVLFKIAVRDTPKTFINTIFRDISLTEVGEITLVGAYYLLLRTRYFDCNPPL
jgi:hypothetical protein